MLKRIFWGLLLSLIVVIVVISLLNRQAKMRYPAVAKQYANVIVFGDSLSDSAPDGQNMGNNYWVKPEGIVNQLGAPITNEISTQNPVRKTWLDYFLVEMPLEAGSDFSNIKGLVKNAAYAKNVSFATASAETGDYYLTDTTWARDSMAQCQNGIGDYGNYNCVPGVLKQLQLYLSNVANKPNPNTLFIIWAGGNDFYQNIVRIASRNGQAIAHPIDNIVQAVKLLMDKGVPASHIYVLNLPDFSMVPALTNLVGEHVKNNYAHRAVLTLISSISQLYNLNLHINLVLQTLGRLSANHIFPIDQLFLDVYFNKEHILQKLRIIQKVDLTCAKAGDFPYCAGFLFYNGMHPTTVIHQYLAKELMSYIQRT